MPFFEGVHTWKIKTHGGDINIGIMVDNNYDF